MSFDRLARRAAVLLAGIACLAVPLAARPPGTPAQPAAASALQGFKLSHWSLEEGAPSRINTITQGLDGFLWIGGVDGLFRFDGVTFERIGPAPESVGRIVVARLLAGPDGTIWIGLARGKGLMVWRDGQLTKLAMPNPSREVNDLARGPDGALWVARGGRSALSLARYRNGRWTEFGPSSGLPEEPVWALLFARDGTLWLTTETAVYRKPAGGDHFEPTGIAVPPRATLAEAPDGTVWLTDKAATRAIGRDGALRPPGPALATPGGIHTLFDRQGDLWGVGWSSGAFRIPAPLHAGSGGPRVRALNSAVGLLSDSARALFEDREGNLWIGGELGLNRVRRVPLAPLAGMPNAPSSAYLLAVDHRGVVQVADDHGVFRIGPGGEASRILTSRAEIAALCPARDSGIWVIVPGEAIRLVDGRAVQRVRFPAGARPNSCGEDSGGRLWLPALNRGLSWLERGTWYRWIGADGTAGTPDNITILADGRAAIHWRSALPPMANAPFLAISDRSPPGRQVEGLFPGAGTLLTSGEAGLAAPLLPNQPLLPAARYPWTASLNGLTQAPSGQTWAIGDRGLITLRSADLAAALARPGRAVAVRQFDFHDGLDSFAQKSAGAQIVVGGDGRVWFATRGGIMGLDPAALARNPQAPQPIVRGLRTADNQRYARSGAVLPPGTEGVEIDYTAASLAVPARVRFRYRLDRPGSDWSPPGAGRTAVLTGLAPGTYRFEVLAANEDGVWSPQPAVWQFTIAKAFQQTWWFRALVALLLCGVLYLLYALRVRTLSERIRLAMLERTRERERIARELHDTMIQGVQGLILRFQAVADRFADDPAAQAVLVPALDRAEDMLVQGRDRVAGLRATRDRDFLHELSHLVADDIYPQAIIAPLAVTGVPRPIAPHLIDDMLAVLGEALNNAACHSEASRIEVGVSFGRWHFGAWVRDNGIGMSPDLVTSKSLPGHFGLVGMQERVRAIGGRFEVQSARGFGTEIKLTIPARAVYARGAET